MVSTGQMNVPSGAYLSAASPPFPVTIDFLMDWMTLMIDIGSVSSSHIIMYLKALHFELTSFEPCSALMQTFMLVIFDPNKSLNTSYKGVFVILLVTSGAR